jgi:hypothetical protein
MHFEQRLRSRLDGDDQAIAGEQAVAVAQHCSGRKDVAHFLAAGQDDALPALAACVVGEHQAIAGGRLAIGKGFGKKHAQNRK